MHSPITKKISKLGSILELTEDKGYDLRLRGIIRFVGYIRLTGLNDLCYMYTLEKSRKNNWTVFSEKFCIWEAHKSIIQITIFRVYVDATGTGPPPPTHTHTQYIFCIYKLPKADLGKE